MCCKLIAAPQPVAISTPVTHYWPMIRLPTDDERTALCRRWTHATGAYDLWALKVGRVEGTVLASAEALNLPALQESWLLAGMAVDVWQQGLAIMVTAMPGVDSASTEPLPARGVRPRVKIAGWRVGLVLDATGMTRADLDSIRARCRRAKWDVTSIPGAPAVFFRRG